MSHATGILLRTRRAAPTVDEPAQTWHRHEPDWLVESALRVAGWHPHPGWGLA
jgi:hypothetical protein